MDRRSLGQFTHSTRVRAAGASLAVACVVLVVFFVRGSFQSGPDLPSFAPEGRTGNATLDKIIGDLVSNDADQLARTYETAEARLFVENRETVTLPAEDWTARLADQERRLYAVYSGGDRDVSPSTGIYLPPREYTILLMAGEDEAVAEHWSFAIQGGTVIEVVISAAIGQPQFIPGTPRRYSFSTAVNPPLVHRHYDRFLVLPPREDLPQPPAAHDLSKRTGDQGVDALLSLAERGEGNRLLREVVYRAEPCGFDETQPQCEFDQPPSTVVDALPAWGPARGLGGPFLEYMPRSDVEDLLRTVLGQVTDVQAVYNVPPGYEPAPGLVADADHLLVLVRELGPYWWEQVGLFERDGRVIGLLLSEGWGLQPPTSFIVPPPAGGWIHQPPDGAYIVPPPDRLETLDAARRSEIPAIDAYVEAANRYDGQAIEGLVAYSLQQPCVERPANFVQSGKLYCRAGEPPGTLINVIPLIDCGRTEFLQAGTIADGVRVNSHGPSRWAIYAVVVEGADFIAVIVPADGRDLSIPGYDTTALRFRDGRIVEVFRACSNRTYVPPNNAGLPWPQYAPSVLLPPP